MKKFDECRRWLVALCASVALLGNAAAATPLPPPTDPAKVSTAVLPEGAERPLILRVCGVCHAIEAVVLRKRTADEWDTQIAKMVGYGAKATDDEQEQIFQYLVRLFLKDAPATSPAAPAPR
jgi:cytochrome c5